MRQVKLISGRAVGTAAAARDLAKRLRSSFGRSNMILRGVGVAIAANGAAFVSVRSGAGASFGDSVFLGAVVLSALLGSWIGGLCAWGLSFAAARWLLAPREAVTVAALGDAPYVMFSLLIAVVTSWFSARYRRANGLLWEAKGELEQRVVRRTSDLASAANRLRREIALRKSTEEEIRSVTAHAGCILWRAELTGAHAEDRAAAHCPSWVVHVQDESAAQRVLPLDIPDGSSYYKAWTRSRHPLDAPAVARHCLDAVLKGKHGYSHEYRCVDRHGETRWLSEDVRVRTIAPGRWQLIGVTTDISESKRAAEALRASEERFSLFMANLPGLAFIKDESGRYVFMNRACEAWFHLDRGRWLLRGGSELHPPDPVRGFVNSEGLVAAGRRSIESVELLPHPLGPRSFVFNWFPIRSRDGRSVLTGAVAIDITDRTRAEEELLAHQEKLRAMSARASESEERERRQIAAALHDHIGSTLAAVQIRLQLLETTLDEKNGRGFAAAARRTLPDVVRDLEHAIAHTRSLTCELSPPLLYEAGMEAAVRWLGDQIHQRHGLGVVVESEGEFETIDQGLKVVAYQGVRELLTNVVKHARATTAWVRLARDLSGFDVTVSDDGVGVGTRPGKRGNSFGLFNLRERLSYLGGTLSIEPAPLRGTRARMTLSRVASPALPPAQHETSLETVPG